jgi:hypothetical protein
MVEERRNADVLHERTDIRPVAVSVTGLVLLLGVVVVVLFMWFFFEHMRRIDVRVEPRGGLAPVYERVTEPLLQTSPPSDLAGMLRRENEILTHYKWVDRQRGIVSIPIDRALDIIAQRGLPPAASAPPKLELGIPRAGHRQTGFEDKVMLPGEP